MNLEEYRTLFTVTSLTLILISTVPVISFVVPFPRIGEATSELWLLSPTRIVDRYSFNVRVGEEYSRFLGVGNRRGSSEYYMVYVKFRNPTQPPPDISNSNPSPLSPLYEFQFVIPDGTTWESLLTFKILDASIQNEYMFVSNISINGVAFSVDSFSMWNSENNGFFFQLFFELYIYDKTAWRFQFHNRFVGIWLNITTS